jgi:hypothetical protein
MTLGPFRRVFILPTSRLVSTFRPLISATTFRSTMSSSPATEAPKPTQANQPPSDPNSKSARTYEETYASLMQQPWLTPAFALLVS